MISIRTAVVYRYRYFKNSKKQIAKKNEYTRLIQKKNIAMKSLMITKALYEFFYRSKIIFKINKKRKN